jgi:hypothetical protein
LLRDGTLAEIRRAAGCMVAAVRGFPHVFSTADAVLPGTSPQRFITFVEATREAVSR